MARKVDHLQRKREIAERALRLFSKVGYENVSLIMIASAAGVSRTVLYRYFCDKREILDAAIATVTGEIEARCAKIIASRESSITKLSRVCEAVVEVMFANKDFLVAVFDFVVGMVRSGADMNRSIHEFTSGTRKSLKLLIEHAKARGEIPSVLIVERISDAIYAQFESCALRIVIGNESDSAAAKKRFADIVKALSNWT